MLDYFVTLKGSHRFARDDKKNKPQDATVAITYKCNARCQMCNIWQIEKPAELPIEAFKNLSPDLRYLNLSGGETFLRTDLPEIVKIVNEVAPNAHIIISSNGLATQLIVNTMKKIHKIDKRVGVRISIDGIGAMHNEVRGVPGIFDAAMNTIEELKKIGVDNLGFSFTIMDKNIDHLKDVYKLTKEKNIELALAVVQNSDIYFGKADNKLTFIDDLKKNLGFIVDSELKTWNPKRWGRAFYNTGLINFAEKNERLLPSGAGFDSLFIDPTGKIFPSNLINLEMGNIKDAKLNDIWQSKKASTVRKKIKDENIQESWIICTIRGEMKKHLPSLAMWAMKNKLRVMLGR